MPFSKENARQMALERWKSEREKRQRLSTIRKAAIAARNDGKTSLLEDAEKKTFENCVKSHGIDVSPAIVGPYKPDNTVSGFRKYSNRIKKIIKYSNITYHYNYDHIPNITDYNT